MKKLSDVFELPLPLGEMDCMLDVFIHSDVDTDESVVAMHAAHAINHVDKLADALELLLSDKAMIHVGNDKHLQAKAALAAYRGEA